MASSLGTMMVRRAANLARLDPSGRSSIRAFDLYPRRGLASAAGSHFDHHGPAKVNIWQEPMNPGNWKEEQFVIVSISGWGLLFYGAFKFFTGGKKDKGEVILGVGICC